MCFGVGGVYFFGSGGFIFAFFNFCPLVGDGEICCA